jgi:hypothetical protein
VLPHWTAAENQRHPTVGTRHAPPAVLHAPFYPQRGPYSSTDPRTLDAHFAEMKAVGAHGGGEVVAVLSWWGQAARAGTADTQGIATDDRVAAALAAVRLAFGLFAAAAASPPPRPLNSPHSPLPFF